MGLESLQLLFNGLHLGLTLGGNSGVDGYSHLTPPVLLELPELLMTALGQMSSSEDTGKLSLVDAALGIRMCYKLACGLPLALFHEALPGEKKHPE
jgi:hypothetical protein